ncbi:15970_t:CDS:2 [Funneliformis caledonium]|uniref:15970_t:CDS:1 n=1 Tax=Funneliformis caledonium TaxID=1117310 RepID=A0A9N9DDW1_9GLOM|nr:15970_t:CDS:2 [Funneliformis caledonium]
MNAVPHYKKSVALIGSHLTLSPSALIALSLRTWLWNREIFSNILKKFKFSIV